MVIIITYIWNLQNINNIDEIVNIKESQANSFGSYYCWEVLSIQNEGRVAEQVAPTNELE